MSAAPLSNIEEFLERSIFHRIRKECVDKGYLPDVLLYNNNPAGQALWEAALATIKTTKGFAIEVFNYSNAQAKNTKKVPRIVIITKGFLPGALGGDSTPIFHKATNNTYDKLLNPPQTVDYFYDVHLIANTVAQIRVLQAILSLALPRRAYINSYDDVATFFIRNIGFTSLDRADEGIMERVYSYEIPDMWEVDPLVIATGVAPLGEITFTQEVGDPIVVTDDLVLQSSSNDITAFTVPTATTSLISTSAKTVTINIPITTLLTSLIATFKTSTPLCTVTIGSTVQESGVTSNDFSIPLIYTVTAPDGTSEDWTVVVNAT